MAFFGEWVSSTKSARLNLPKLINLIRVIIAKDVAKHCAVNESTLYWAFKTAANKTPNEIKNKFLCQKAIMLIINTNKSVQEISDSLGFSSTSYFRKILKANTGKTPREIRKSRIY
ncbi:MAG: helix-turn-helix transcriptional regulator [Ruminococcaceae bacterium]|nr:helix-turn-helix transcriptional regulator [Oscillospiraceae bacterium]